MGQSTKFIEKFSVKQLFSVDFETFSKSRQIFENFLYCDIFQLRFGYNAGKILDTIQEINL